MGAANLVVAGSYIEERFLDCAARHAQTACQKKPGRSARNDRVVAASLWRNGYEPKKQAMYAVHDGSESKLVECASFFDEVGGDQ